MTSPSMQHLARLASGPRPTGGTAVAAARSYCEAVLTGLGFEVATHEFEYSAFSGSFGAPLAGAWIAFIVSLAAAQAVRPPSARGAAEVSFVILVVALAVTAVAGRYFAGRGVLSFPWMRRCGVNLEARRKTPPVVWLVAHLDSKWQPVPMSARVTGIAALLVIVVIAIAMSVLQWSTGQGRAAWPWVFGATWLAALPVMLSFVGTGGTGALDNASGVASVLAAAALLAPAAPVGVLITDAEELALAGARAWMRQHAPAVVLNCDGVDDRGVFTIMYSGRVPERVTAAIRSAAAERGEALRVMRVLPGVLADSVAFSEGGWEAVTLSRGSLRSLARVHTSSDTLATLQGTSIATSAALLARAATALC